MENLCWKIESFFRKEGPAHLLSKESKMIATTAKRPVAVAKKTPYCDTCYRKGLSEKEYTSHYTKSEAGPRGMIVCPTILNALCKACGGKGHWASEKFCPVMRREAKERRYTKREHKTTTPVVVVVKKNENRFALLEEDLVPEVVPTGPSWADMARKPAVLIEKEKEEPSNMMTLGKTVFYESKTYEPLMTDAEREAYKIWKEREAAGCFSKHIRGSWLEDDDDENEEEEW